jgi:hypothetical protein
MSTDPDLDVTVKGLQQFGDLLISDIIKKAMKLFLKQGALYSLSSNYQNTYINCFDSVDMYWQIMLATDRFESGYQNRNLLSKKDLELIERSYVENSPELQLMFLETVQTSRTVSDFKTIRNPESSKDITVTLYKFLVHDKIYLVGEDLIGALNDEAGYHVGHYAQSIFIETRDFVETISVKCE